MKVKRFSKKFKAINCKKSNFYYLGAITCADSLLDYTRNEISDFWHFFGSFTQLIVNANYSNCFHRDVRVSTILIWTKGYCMYWEVVFHWEITHRRCFKVIWKQKKKSQLTQHPPNCKSVDKLMHDASACRRFRRNNKIE